MLATDGDGHAELWTSGGSAELPIAAQLHGTVATGPLGIVSIGDGQVLVSRDGIDYKVSSIPCPDGGVDRRASVTGLCWSPRLRRSTSSRGHGLSGSARSSSDRFAIAGRGRASGGAADGADAYVAALDLAAAIATGSRRGRLSLPRLTWLVGAAGLLPVSPVAARGVSMRLATAVLALVLGLGGCSSTNAPASPPPTAALAPPTASTVPAAPSSPDASIDGTPTAAPDLASQFREILGTGFNGSALMSRYGDLLFAEGIGMADDAHGIPNTPSTQFRLGSVTKQFTAMAVLMLASQGLLKTTDPVCDYVDTCPDGWDAVTVEHLLSHSSGIASFTDQPGFDLMKAAISREQRVRRIIRHATVEPLQHLREQRLAGRGALEQRHRRAHLHRVERAEDLVG